MSSWRDTIQQLKQMQAQLEGSILLNLRFMPDATILLVSYLGVDAQLTTTHLDEIAQSVNFLLEMDQDPRRVGSISKSQSGYQILITCPN